MITQELVKKLFTYKNGNLYRRVSRGNAKKGNITGYIASNGYKNTKINYKPYPTSRLIFLYHHGFLPQQIDHIDRNPLNNDIKNLRAATPSQNAQNISLTKSNTSGVKGVIWLKRTRMWKATINVGGKNRHYGYFYDKEVAAQILRIARIKHHGEFANNG